jgi:hypothetical protein
VREKRRRVVERNGGRLDDVEFTFRSGGSARTLGEATLRNRIKSHPDVGERWYPEILAEIRAQQKKEREEGDRKKAAFEPQQNGAPLTGGLGQVVEAH